QGAWQAFRRICSQKSLMSCRLQPLPQGVHRVFPRGRGGVPPRRRAGPVPPNPLLQRHGCLAGYPTINPEIRAALFAFVSALGYKRATTMNTNAGPCPEQLLRLARAGSGPALGQLLELYRNYLTLLARLQIGRRLQGKADPADLVQEAFLEATE